MKNMKTRVGRYLIYGLLDPRNKTLRYIGKTHKRREWRLGEHIELAKENDAIIVIGGKNSSNSKKLFEIANKLNPKTFFIENVKSLNFENFRNIKSIGITAGASTPDWIIKKICSQLKNYELKD